MSKLQNQKPWWDQLPPSVTGDAIVANINSSHDVAIGKNIQQTIISSLGAPTPGDKQIIEQKFSELGDTLGKLGGQVDANTKKMAEFQIKLLQGELTKTDPKETPSASTIVQVGDWLLDNVPSMAEAVVGLFATPAVGKIVGKAGEAAIQWTRNRLGKASAGAG
jgi:hypothetical protein